jgi:hypothetical protein
MTVKALIDALNNLTIGEFGALEQRVRELGDEAGALGLEEAAKILGESLERLREGDPRGFRKKIQHAVSRLGHAREGSRSRQSRASRLSV